MNSFISYVLQTTIAISVFYILYWLLLRKETFFRFNRYYFIFSLIVALLLPFLNLGELPVFHRSPPAHAISQGYGYLQNAVVVNTVNISEKISERYTIADYLIVLYLTGFVFLFLRLIYQAGFLALRIRRSGIIEISGSTIVLDKKVSSPFSFFSWIFMSPSQVEDESISDIILHEKEHIRQKHTLDLFMIELVSAFQWMNPFVWLLRKSMKETHEYLADHAVLKHGVPVNDYQKLLISYAMGVGQPALITPLNFSLNKKRMIMMKKMKSPNVRKWRSLLLLPLILILSLAFSNPFSGDESLSQRALSKLNGFSDSVNSVEKIPSVDLYILDGKEISMEQLMTIRPESISFKVLKGAEAVKLYGEKANNGVVIMTSKNLPDKNTVKKYEVSGKILNGETNKPMPGVNIVIMGTTMGTVSDIDGSFSLHLDKAKVKVAVSFVGFETQILDIEDGDKLEVKLKKGVTTLNLEPDGTSNSNKSVQPDHPTERNTTGEIFFVVEDMPYFPGGKGALSEFISSHTKYPKKAKKNSISGTVYVNFTVDEEGSVKDIYIDKSKSIDPDLDKEAIRVISGMPKWKPAVQRGKAVPVELSVPVEFTL